MTRALRVEYEGAFYHILNRGNGGEKVLKQKRDKERFLQYAGEAAERYSFVIHTYCLMDNHFHVVVETREANLSTAMQWLNVSYATWYNKKHSRSGHVFQGRFKSYLIDADEYLAAVSRYIHLNPVRAGMAENPAVYQWSSYGCFVEQREKPGCLETRKVLSYFSPKTSEAIKEYKRFVENIEINALENPSKQAVEGFIIGGAGFADRVRQQMVTANHEQEKEIPQLKRLKPKPALESIIEAASYVFCCRREDIVRSGKKHNLARDIAIYIARTSTGLSCRELGEHFGGITGAGITMKYRQIKNLAEKEKGIRENIANISSRIFNI